MKKITILVLDGVMDTSLAITLDALRAAQALSLRTGSAPRVTLRTIAVKTHITTGAGLRFSADATLRNAELDAGASDWIIVPGLGLRSAEEITGRFNKTDAVDAIRWLRQVATGKVNIAASCSAVFLLAQAGLLSGRRATMTWWLASAFRTHYPDVLLDEAKMLVRDGRILTAGAALSQLDLILAVITDVMGASVAHLCSRYLLIDQRPSQARYMMHTHLLHEDATVIAAERWIDANLGNPITVKALSSQLAVSAKTLGRRIEAATGISPIKFIQRRRLTQAAHLLETTALSIEAIAAQVGYRDGTALRKLVKREFGINPTALR
jgi:transcriptional regulator GlxA family with amidase domain